MPKITNERYKNFIKTGVIKLFEMDELDKGLKIAGLSKFGKEARAFLIIIYYTGARPIELLQLKASNFKKDKNDLEIQIPTAKNGRPRMVSIPFARKYVKELYDYVNSFMPDILVFYDLISRKERKYTKKNGETIIYIVITDKIYYYMTKWIGLNPYFFRHNRMSSLAQNGLDLIDLQQFKGAKRVDSVMPYLHMSKNIAKKIGRKIK